MHPDPSPLVWTSGNFRDHPRAEKPFNGVRISAVPKFDTKGLLFSLQLTLEDFTNTKSGARLQHTFQPVENGLELRLQKSGDFTLSGALKLELSSVIPDHFILMWDDGSFGETDQRHQVIGGLLEIPQNGPPSKDSGTHSTPPAKTPPATTPPATTPPATTPPAASTPVPSLPAPSPPAASPPAPSPPATPVDAPSAGSLSVTPDPDHPGGFHLTGQAQVNLPGGPVNLDLRARIHPSSSSPGPFPQESSPESEPAGPAEDSSRLSPPMTPPNADATER